MSIPNAPVNVGDVLAGRYRTVRLLGMGAMGVVVEAVHVTLGQRVALKFLLAHRATNQALHERFLREARAAVSLKSQHVTRVTDVGTLDSGAPYMVMELLEGRDLAAVLDERGALPVAEAVEYVLQVCEAVGEAHRAGIVHRDLKPANLFVTTHADGSPCVKVLDFGVSKFTGAGHLKVTAEGQAVGSPLYMSPEQMQAKDDVDARSDIWALGVILYELITATTPFHAETMLALHTNVLVKPPVPLTKHLPDAPPQLEAIILQCLDKTPDRRWPNVGALAAALVPYAPPRAVPYAARVAAVLGVEVEPSRPTHLLTRDAAMLRASEPAANVPALSLVATTNGATSGPAGVPAKVRRGSIAAGGAVILALALATVAALRWGTGSTAATSSAVASGLSVAPAGVGAASVPPEETAIDAPASASVSVSASVPVVTSASALADAGPVKTKPSPRPAAPAPKPAGSAGEAGKPPAPADVFGRK